MELSSNPLRQPSVTLRVQHRNTSITLSVPISMTLHELCHQHLYSSLATISSATPDLLIFKLILKKPPRTLISPGDEDGKSMVQLGFIPTDNTAQYPILLITTEQSEVDRNEEATQTILKRQFARQEALKKPAVKLRDTSWERVDPGERRYRFHGVKLLPNLPHEARRQELIERLSNDRSIVKQMLKFKLSVGRLGELHPWTDPHILGLNQSSGQEIRLRLLADDLKSVRPFSIVRRVLSHELAHNHFGPHDNQFKEFDSKIHKGMLAYDEEVRRSTYRLGGELGDHYDPESREPIEFHCSTTTTNDDGGRHLPPNLQSNTQTLGGPSNSSAAHQPIPGPKTAAAEAALKRASQHK